MKEMKSIYFLLNIFVSLILFFLIKLIWFYYVKLYFIIFVINFFENYYLKWKFRKYKKSYRLDFWRYVYYIGNYIDYIGIDFFKRMLISIIF